MSKMTMTREDEREFYATPENQEPQGPARRRKASKLSADRGAEMADPTYRSSTSSSEATAISDV